jgi:hypothetical protein
MLSRFAEGSRGGPVQHPLGSAWRLDEFSGILAWVRVAFEDLLERLRLVFACGEKDDGPGRVYDRNGQRDTGGIELRHGVGHDPAVVNLERRGLGEKARGVAVAADAEQDQVEPWKLLSPEELPQLHFIGRCRLIRRQLAPHPVDAPDRNVVEECLAGHAVVRVFVVGRDVTLVPEEDVDPAPVYALGVVAGQDPVRRLRGRAAGEHYSETATLIDGLLCLRRELPRGGPGELFGTLVDVDAQRSSTSTAAPRAAS